jgi:spermidine synthase
MFSVKKELKRFIFSQREAICFILDLLTVLSFQTKYYPIRKGNLRRKNIIYTNTTAYQRINIIRTTKAIIGLYLNNNRVYLVLLTNRYHEAPLYTCNVNGKSDNVLILGGGDGLAAREVLKYKDVKKFCWDSDEGMTKCLKPTRF